MSDTPMLEIEELVAHIMTADGREHTDAEREIALEVRAWLDSLPDQITVPVGWWAVKPENTTAT